MTFHHTRPLAVAVGVVLTVAVSAAIGIGAKSPAGTQQTLTSDQVFETTKVWTVHLTLSREGFAALTPVRPPTPPPPPSPTVNLVPRPQPVQTPNELPPARLRELLSGFLGPEGGRNGLSTQRGIDFEYVHAALDLDSRHFTDVAVRAKGNGTFGPVARFPKPSIKIDLNKYVKGQKLAGVNDVRRGSIRLAEWWSDGFGHKPLLPPLTKPRISG